MSFLSFLSYSVFFHQTNYLWTFFYKRKNCNLISVRAVEMLLFLIRMKNWVLLLL